MGSLTNIAKRSARSAGLSSADASNLAYLALGFLTEEADRIERFLSLTGMDPADLRALAGEKGFQLAVLDHIAGDEELLLAFCEARNVDPDSIGRARLALGGGERD